MKQQQSRRAATVASIIGCGVGALLLAAGVVCSVFGGGQMMYSPEQAKEWEDASAAWHGATSGHADQHSPGSSAGAVDRAAAVALARERFERADADLRNARFVKNRLGGILVWAGLAMAGAFGVGYLICRGE